LRRPIETTALIVHLGPSGRRRLVFQNVLGELPFILLPETTLIARAVQMEKRTNWAAAVSLILGSSFLLALLFFLRVPFDAPLPYREFRRIISVAPFVGVVLGHLARRQIRLSEGRVGGLQLAIAGLFLSYLGVAFLIATVVR
jgi:hypothetical protein